MNFSQALNLIRSGLAVRRQGWKQFTYIYSKHISAMAPFIALRDSAGDVMPWTPTHDDLYADDWQEAKK